ncbi:MAG: glycosyltransferase family 2 protein, partial [Verrucomicrobiota bacterium]|nr:glycosyltransferase family 2 protein [Verrucomicrobiota bacterium]
MPALSVIIPTLNEASELPETLKRARAIPEVKEIIVVDAGSTDDTEAIAREHNCTVLESEPSRGKQLRLGAEQASGDAILFLHADTWLPENAGVVIAKTLARPLVVAGGFYKRFRDGDVLPGSRLRCWLLWALTNRLFGDQAIFVKRPALEAIGGVPDVPLMEEFELCKKISAHGR